jgi:crotonobetainyl-CoA:carnitine CoA-transferase CaiB-like acyl-CoA transferase
MGALSGIRVVEFEGWIAGSLLGMLLADQGADVILICKPGSPIYSAPGAQMLARGKRSIVLDLSLDSDREIALKLAATADITIENLRPKALDNLGIGYDVLRSVNPRLIHVCLPGFARDDLVHTGLPAYEGIIGASVGLFTEINLLKPLLGMDPVYTPLSLPSIYGAVQAAIACNAALLARDKTGHGNHIEVPLASAAAMAMSSIYLQVEGAPSHYETPKLPKFVKSVVLPLLKKYWRNSPEKQRRFYAKIQSAVPALMTAYPCADDRLLYVFAIDNAPMATKLLETLGLLEAARAFGFVTANPYDGPIEGDNLAATSSLSRKAQAWLRENVGRVLRRKPASEWETILADAGCPAAMVRTTDEWLLWEPLRASEALVRNGQNQLAPGRQCWSPGHPSATLGPAPQRDEHRSELFAEAKSITLLDHDFDPPNIAPWKPLAGVKVLDFASMVAGPVAGRTLAELGAEVVKIDSTHPHHGPRLTCWYGLDVNQGKQSILIDLKTKDGQAILAKLVADADVVIHNFTTAAAKKLNFDLAALTKLNQRILVCDIAAYGGPIHNAISTRHGYDPVLQMASGISTRYGSVKSPELHGIASCIDNLTGYSAAFGIASALAANARGATIQAISTSLVQAANLIQFPYSVGGGQSGLSGQTAMGESERVRLWRVRDGWIFTAPSQKQIAEFDVIKQANDFTKKSTDAAVALFIEKGIAAIKVAKLADLRASFANQKHSVRSIRRTMQELSVTQLEPDYIRTNGSRLASISPTQKPGTSTRTIMKTLGSSDIKIDVLVAERAVALKLSESLLP